jgi:hypothetical protein
VPGAVTEKGTIRLVSSAEVKHSQRARAELFKPLSEHDPAGTKNEIAWVCQRREESLAAKFSSGVYHATASALEKAGL